MESQSQGRLNKVINALDQIVDLLGTRAEGFARDDKEFVRNRWADLAVAGQESVLRKVEEAVSKIDARVVKSDTAGDVFRKRAYLVDLVPDVYDLRKKMQGFLGNELEWQDPIPQAIFSRAITRLFKATFEASSAMKWRKEIEESAVFRQWGLIRFRARVAILDETYKALVPVEHERKMSIEENRQAALKCLYPKLDRYQELAGLPRAYTHPIRRDSNVMLPPPIPSHAGPARSTTTRQEAFQVKSRHSTEKSPDGPHPIVEGAPSLFHNGRVVAVDHWGPSTNGSTQATRYLSRGTRESPLKID